MANSAPGERRSRRGPAARGRRHLLLLPAVLLSLVLGIPTGALAFWTGSGAGAAGGTTGTLAPPTAVAAAQQGQTGGASVVWLASPTAGVTGYRAERANVGASDWTTVCTTITAVSCSGPGIGDGDYQFRVIALRGSWTAPSVAPYATATIDTVRPTPTIAVAPDQANPTNADNSSIPIRFAVAFSEPVTGFTTGDVTLSGTAASLGATAAVTAQSATDYTVAVTGVTVAALGGGTVIASIAAGVAQDGAGNANIGSSVATVLYDPNRPLAAAAPDLTDATDSSAPSLAATTGHSDDITSSMTRTFTQTVGTAVPSDVVGGMATLYRSTSPSATEIAVGAPAVVTAAGYSVSDTEALGDGIYYYSVRFTDAAGNVGLAGSRLAVTFDTAAPVPTISYTRNVLAGTVTASGVAPHASDDILSVDVRICNGSSMNCSASNTASTTVSAVNGQYSWSTNSLLGGILASSTVQVSQYDKAGNRGSSAIATLSGLLG